MSDNILILGNGFDIAMGRKTSYEDFLMFADYIYICLNYPIRYPEYDSEEVERVNLNKLERGDISEIETDLKRKVSDFSSTQEYESLIFETLKEFNFDELLQIFSTDLIKMLKEYQVVCKQQTAIGISPDYLEEFDIIFNKFLFDLKENKYLLNQFSDKVTSIKRSKRFDFFDIDLIEGVINSKIDSSRNLKWLGEINNNIFIKFMKDYREELGANWSSIESIISDIAEAVYDLKENIEENLELFSIYKEYLSNQALVKFKERFRHKKNFVAYKFVVECIYQETVTNSNQLTNMAIVEKTNESFINALEELTNYLEFYLTYLDRLDFDKNKISKKESVLDVIPEIQKSKVINFNYTDTALKLFNIPLMSTHFIHGKIDFNRINNGINTMVFGIEDKEDDIEAINLDLIPYQKYYQRTIKETGNDFEIFFKGSNIKNIIVFGHSVNPLDKEIFRKCFELAEYNRVLYQFIFVYHNEQSKRSIVKNLAIILGKNKIIELTGKNKIKFVKSDNLDKMIKNLY